MNSVIVLIAAYLVALEDSKAPQGDLFRAIHDAFVSNQAAFPFGQVKFTFIQGTAKNEVAARDGNFEPGYGASGIYVFAQRRARYERVFSEEDMRKSNQYMNNSILSILDSFRMATNDEITLYDSISATARSGLARGLRLAPGRAIFDRDFRFPLSLGQPNVSARENLGKFLRNALETNSGTRVSKIESDLVFEDHPVVKIAFTLKYGSSEYWIDLERGAVPLKVVERAAATGTSRELRTVTHFDDLRLVPNRGWLPFKESWWHSRDSTGGQIVIQEASFDRPPKSAAFNIEFPQPISIVNEAKGVRYPPRSVWNITSLPSSGSRGVEKVEYASVPEAEIPKLLGERVSWAKYQLLVLGIVTLTLTIVLISWIRRRRNV